MAIWIKLIINVAIIMGFACVYAQKQTGKATFYSKRATGARTASGERLHHDSFTCAHKTFPFGAKLKVTNPANNKWVVVKVTDRGPFGNGKIIDLSWAAANAIDIIYKGVASVIVELIDTNKIPYKKQNNNEIPEFDFNINDIGYNFIEQWNKNTKTKQEELLKKKPKIIINKKNKKHIENRDIKSKLKPQKQQQNLWQEAYEKLKNWAN